MSAPDASCACAITWCVGYLPVPTIRRDWKVLPAITKLLIYRPVRSRARPTTNKIHDLNRVAGRDHCRVEPLAFDDDQVVLDGDAAGVNPEFGEQRADAQRGRDLVRLAVHVYLQ